MTPPIHVLEGTCELCKTFVPLGGTDVLYEVYPLSSNNSALPIPQLSSMLVCEDCMPFDSLREVHGKVVVDEVNLYSRIYIRRVV